MNQYLLITQLWEKFRHLKVVELQADWSDIGSWTSLAKLFPPDSNENRSNSEETLFFNSEDTFVYSSAFRPVVSVGLKFNCCGYIRCIIDF